ncbi:UPF0669 protein v1g209471 [Tribolium castaneum]|uniref:UPF0669 protein C6orf120 homolog-like Protein n=1 Tax=Tribolium castaneum TaxID=7070 RepID=D2A684_TRICA|nr:PREDICTED: UPF0669 protein v1g209471 [Tribolium castaneum]EFA04962.1 UPF0669 protein C6orf120 homolog-like Protein [Tribolium castaneum]|eukprot:XP_008194848.1 PREDICTED: UPF0669 protein v1g209471 [Tribolium castaneum]
MHPQVAILLSWLAYAAAKVSLFKLEGEVNGQEFVYYKIMHPGNLLLVLESLEGDADVYVSEKTPSPTYHPDAYDFHSATCGTDSVTIPRTMRRPMAVGIYGYSASSKYTLEVFQLPSDGDNNLFEEDDPFKAQVENNVEYTTNEKKEVRKVPKVKKKLRNIPNGLWPFLELFEMLFL